VLEIGYGTGVNFQYYNPSAVKSISALDIKPDATKKTKENLPINFYTGRAESLPFENESFDTVAETLVFCSVENLNTSISEVLRVLKPNGLFIFIDHVQPENKELACLFKAANTVWPKIAGGCNPVPPRVIVRLRHYVAVNVRYRLHITPQVVMHNILGNGKVI